jgi:hypothetical protein
LKELCCCNLTTLTCVKNLKTLLTSIEDLRLSRYTAYMVLFILLLTSCAPLRPDLGEPVSQSFADGLMQEWSDNAALISTVQGLAEVKVKAPMTSINGVQVVIAEKPDKLRAETLSPFGTTLVSLTTVDGRLGVLLTAQNIYYTGAASPKNLEQFVHIPLAVSDLVALLLYQPPLIEAWKEEAFNLKDGGWLLVRHGTLQRQEMVFDDRRQLVETAYFKNNNLMLRATYTKFNEQGALYPTLLTFEVPEKYAVVTLDFSDVETNGRLRPGVFEVKAPVGAKVVYLPE